MSEFILARQRGDTIKKFISIKNTEKIMRIINRHGFTLVEIMIVVAVIGLLVALSIPVLLRARVSANEGVTEGNIRTLSTAIENFRSDQVPVSYPANLMVLTIPGAQPPYIDTALAAGTRSGYQYTYVPGGVDGAGNFNQYTLNADPVSPGFTGNNGYFVDESGVIRAANPGPANAGSTPL